MRKPQNNTMFFYQGNKLITVKEGANHRSIFRTADVPLAEQQSADGNGLLATDDKGSVLAVQGEGEEETHRYTAYGHDPTLPSARTLLGFNGATNHTVIEYYVLGNGYRAYIPKLHRFCSPDSLSPFGKKNINAYAYCEGNPVNYTDPSGHISIPKIFSYLDRGIRKPISLPSRSSEKYYLIVGKSADSDLKHRTTLVETPFSHEEPTSIYIPQRSLPAFRQRQEKQRQLITYKQFNTLEDPVSFDKEIARLGESIEKEIETGRQIFERFKPREISQPVETVTLVRNPRQST